MTIKTFIGQKFGKLTVLEKVPTKFKTHKTTYWLCLCECGAKTEVARSNLKTTGKGGVKSCGCLIYRRRENSPFWTGTGEISNTLISKIKHNAKRRKVQFSVDTQYLWDLFIKQNRKCALSGLPIAFSQCHNDLHTSKFTASLDRIDSRDGYVVGNVQWVHKDINMMKQRYSVDYFIEMCQHVTKWDTK